MSDHLEPSGHRATPRSRSAKSSDSVGRRRRQRPKRHIVAKVIVAAVVATALVTGLSAVYFARHLNDHLTVLDVSDRLKDRPDKKESKLPKEALNILVMGSDDRDGE